MKKNTLLKVKAGCTLLVLLLAFFVTNVQPARAIPVEEVASIPQILADVKLTFSEKLSKILKTVGAKLVGTTVRNTLNRLAMDAAKRVASSNEGQKPTYIVSELGGYWKNVGDAAAGDFIDSIGEDWGVDLCTPPSANIQAKISLGLVQTLAPEAPDCTVTQLVSNYSSAYEKIAAMESGEYLKAVQVSLDPSTSQLGGAFTLFGKTLSVNTKAAETEKDKTIVNQGWLDVRNIAGKLEGTPGNAKSELETAKNIKAQSLLSSTGDALVDASNTFLNQLAYEGFQRVLRELSKGKSDGATFNPTNLKSAGVESLIQYGESIVSEKLASVIKPRFDVRSDYSIVTDLASCVDKNNPSPTSCVIDDKFSQAISEKLTVGEALEKGYLHGDWLVSDDSKSDSTYTLRSASILRKYRIVPVGWEQAISVATKNKYKVTFQDLVSCFDGKGLFSNDFDKNNQDWCRGLVDPNWVLKAPLNFCSKQGYGNQILSSLVSKDANGLATLAISRAGDYCADDQTCIKEKTDGSCEVYGYCNEEKRTWKFGTDSCEPVYNTCQTFTSSTDKQTASFLENTLDYSTCDQNNTGCKQYSYNGSYSSASNSVSWDKNYSIFFNSKAVSCDASNEGCTKLLRGKPGWADVNYVMNSDFGLNNVDDTSSSNLSSWHWPIENGVGTIIDYNNTKALAIAGQDSSALYSNNNQSLLPKNLTPVLGWSYTLSADVKLVSGDKITMTLGNSGAKSEVTGYDWTSISVTASNISTLDFKIKATAEDANASFIIQNLKLTPNNYKPDFSDYAAFPVYEKLIPNYLESSCYNSVSGTGDYTLKDNAPAICSNFARKCNRNEVGCELFTSAKDLFSVAAKANPGDYCDASCVGYDTYLAKASYFYGTSADNLIPEKTSTCNAESAGCASFTNLDAATSGGENVEYFAKVRQCIKPDTSSCGDFYSWDNAQLKVMSLKKDASGNPAVVNSSLDASCNQETYNLPITDPRYNSDCREFYNKSGKITYHLISNTISCSDDCRTYRLNKKNIDKTLSAGSCVDAPGIDRSWDAAAGTCYACQNGGIWDNAQKACIYKAIPSEGTTCSASEVGCREYNGNNGNSLKQQAAYDFEAGVDDFSVFGFGSVTQSTESTSKNGHSLLMSGGVVTDASQFATEGSSYVIKFIAKASSAINGKIYFQNSNVENISTFNVSTTNPQGSISFKGDNQWHIYEFNLTNLDHVVEETEKLVFTVSGSLLIDNIIINEVTDKYYLVQGTSQVPDVCFYDMLDVYQGPNFNLGCSAYTDRAGTVHNLHQFSDLCQTSAVGCEQMIQTNNSSKYYSYTVNLNSEDKNAACVSGTPGCIEVPGAQAIYAVFDAAKQCNSADAGCSRFGYLKTVGNTSSWVDSYKKALPDAYNNEATSPLCRSNEVGCDTWVSTNGAASYFKTPGLNTCVFKNNYWYKSPVKRCDVNSDGKIADTEKTGSVCFSDADCGTKKCITDTNDYPCNVTYLKTVGLGGLNGRIATPDGAVGLCNTESSGCSEYIDPVSKHVNNLIYNPAAEKIDGSLADKWVPLSGGAYAQRINIKPNKLYILQVEGDDNGKTVDLGNFSTVYNVPPNNTVRILKEDNTYGDLTETVSTKSSVIFNSGANNYVTVFRHSATTDTVSAASISLKEAVINYQIKTNIDTTSCNGLVNTDAGCVLFNARTMSGASGLKTNIWNATLTTESSSPSACGDADTNCFNNANTVVKVSPDRVCSRWLSCQTYTEDPVTHEKTCYKMGECDQLNEKNECGNFLVVDGTTRDIKNSQNKNATGYSLINNWYIGGMKEVGVNTDAHFDFENTSVNLTCKRNIDVTGKAALVAVQNSACVFDRNINDSLVLTPENAPTNYPAHGKGYLKVLNYYQISPQSEKSTIPAYTNQDYYINYLVNTKGSSARAKLVITDENNNVKATFTDSAPNGWERRVYKFNISNNVSSDKTKKPIKLKIYLTSDAANLTTGYVYFDDINIEPVLQTGTSSYVAKDCRLYPGDDSVSCLSTNNNVIKDGLFGYCLQYDPANPGVCLMWYPTDQISPITRTSQSTLGYSGKFPLYYCTEANGNFDLVEKIIASPAKDCSKCNNVKEGTSECKIIIGSCAGVSDPNYITIELNEGYVAGKDNSFSKKICIPNQDPDKMLVPAKKVILDPLDGPLSNRKCGYPNVDDAQIVYYESWSKYDGTLRKINDYIDEASNAAVDGFDSIMVLEGGKSLESDLKYVASADPDKVFRISCNKFSKFVENDGTNAVWSGRIGRSSIYSTTTPNFFSSSLNRFGRSREDVPFGAASISGDYDLSNSEPLLLRNQYSKQLSETIFAGRPYGCSGGGCSNIGQCSLNSNVYCLLGTANDTVSNKSCAAGGNGTCIALWSSVPKEADAISNLNQIFVKKYGDYSYQNGGYSSIGSTAFFKSIDSMGPTDSPHLLTTAGNIGKVLPDIKKLSFTFEKDRQVFPVVISNGSFTVDSAGLYKLSFNAIIDEEQQPMKQITIDWGDSTQVITGLDNKPEDGSPHVFYHFYLKGTNHVEVEVTDNWGAFKRLKMSGTNWQ